VPGRSTLLVACGLFIGCRETPGRPPPPPEPGSAAITCEEYFRHGEELTQFPHPEPYNEAELRYCHEHTDEQLRCSVAAMSVDEHSLCEQFKDPERRALARRLAPSVRASWPGSAPLMRVLVDTVGCSFGGLVGPDRLPLSDTEVVASFAVRETTTTGDPLSVLAWLHRATPADAWRCVRTDPPELCATLEACRP
jgi:hypothetical protein